MAGFLAPTGFTNYMRPGVEGVNQRNISIGGRGNMGSQSSGGVMMPSAFPGVAGYPGGMGVGNAPGLSTQEQYGGPLMAALQNLVSGINVPGGGNGVRQSKNLLPNETPPTTQQNQQQQSVQGVK